MLLRPASKPTVTNLSSVSSASAAASRFGGLIGNLGTSLSSLTAAAASSAISNDLELSLRLCLVNCWLGSFRTTELTYEGSKLVQLEASLYAEDILKDD